METKVGIFNTQSSHQLTYENNPYGSEIIEVDCRSKKLTWTEIEVASGPQSEHCFVKLNNRTNESEITEEMKYVEVTSELCEVEPPRKQRLLEIK